MKNIWCVRNQIEHEQLSDGITVIPCTAYHPEGKYLVKFESLDIDWTRDGPHYPTRIAVHAMAGKDLLIIERGKIYTFSEQLLAQRFQDGQRSRLLRTK